MVVAAFVLLVADHQDHDVGRSDIALDRKARVSWAWSATRKSKLVHKGSVKTLRLDVRAGTVNASRNGEHADMLRHASSAANELLPLLARSWSSSAPTTLCGNFSKKLGCYERKKDALVPDVVDEKGKGFIVKEFCSTPMESFDGAKRAVKAMLVASIFATELSMKQDVPVVVLGRPPGHHATCGHDIGLDAPLAASPGGKLVGCSLSGGCFYPSCWVAAVHALRKGAAKRLAYVDVDAHKPDGIWRETERLSQLSNARRAKLLGAGNQIERVVFGSVHIDAFPNPGVDWKSVNCVMPKGQKRAFEVSVVEELLPQGTYKDGDTTNAEVLACFSRWQKSLFARLRRCKPTGLFVGMGFDLHAEEKEIRRYKRVGLGLFRKHYRAFLASLPANGLQRGPVVLTLEGGYTKEAVMDGMNGVLEGLVKLSYARSRSKLHLGKMSRSLQAQRRKQNMNALDVKRAKRRKL